jgi:hypothetical protein
MRSVVKDSRPCRTSYREVTSATAEGSGLVKLQNQLLRREKPGTLFGVPGSLRINLVRLGQESGHLG